MKKNVNIDIKTVTFSTKQKVCKVRGSGLPWNIPSTRQVAKDIDAKYQASKSLGNLGIILAKSHSIFISYLKGL